MKKRNRGGRRSMFSPRQKAHEAPARRGWRKRKSWTFERLEDRNLFSATPFTYSPGMSGLLSQDQVSLNELYWSVKQAGVLSQYDPAQLAANSQWVVLSNGNVGATGAGGESAGMEFSAGLHRIDTTGLTFEEALSTLQNSEDVLAFYPLVPTKEAATGMGPMSFFDEPMFPYQWHLRNTGGINIGNPDYQVIEGVPGEDINVVEAWNRGYTGAGVTVAVVDSGIEMDHPDLIDNINTALSFDFLENDNDPSPRPGNVNDFHGTAVAGIIGADGDNGYGGVGIAPNVQLVGVRIFSESDGNFTGIDDQEAQIFAYRNDVIDIYNHSWGSNNPSRDVNPIGPNTQQAIRESVLFGREVDGLARGVIHVFSSGNGGGHDFGPGFPGFGWWDSAEYAGHRTRYVVTVGGVDHDGDYFNEDGSLTNYPETGPNVLVVAPTASFFLDIGIDEGTGSGIFTTDSTGEDGRNVSPLPSGFEVDRDFLDDTIIPGGIDFTSRMNGTSASAPMVSGVVALMLEASDPDGPGPLESPLTYRDVQEILLRSARYVDPTNEGWEVNYREVFQDPALGPDPITMAIKPLENPFRRFDDAVDAVTDSFPPGPLPPPDPNLFTPHPIDDYMSDNLAQFTNGAGYAINYAVGIFEEQTGWAHGVVDAGMAVKLAEQWVARDQDNRPEVTYTTFVRPRGSSAGTIAAAAFVGPDAAPAAFIVPGSWGDSDREFGAFYDEFFAADDPMNMDDGPFSGDDPPVNDRGFFGGSSASALPLHILEGFEPPLMEVEWVELKVEIQGPSDALNELRLAIKSPDGTISELTHVLENDSSFNMNYLDRNLNIGGPTSPGDGNSPLIWTFSSNRHWGERTDDFIEVDPVTGDERKDIDKARYLDTVNSESGEFLITNSIVHGWELIAENYSSSNLVIDSFEFVFHGQRLAENSERILGTVGIDSNQDDDFNFTREVQQDTDGDGFITHVDYDIWGPGGVPDGIADVRQLDTSEAAEAPEKYAGGIVVQAFEAGTEILVAEFITGGDGNYYFDLEPGTYDIKLDPLSLTEENLIDKDDAGLDPRYLKTWTITIDDTDNFTRNAGREVPLDANNDGVQDAIDTDMDGIPDLLLFRYEEYRDVNFLLDPGAPLDENVEFSGFVFADVDGDGVFDGGDTRTSGFRVYADLDGSGQFEAGEPSDIVETGEDGNFSLTVQVTAPQLITLRAETDMVGWVATLPVGAKFTSLASPGDDPRTGIQFGFRPPAGSENPNPNPTPGNTPGRILGSVFDDRDSDGVRDGNEEGVSGLQVFADLDFDGVFDPAESFTDANTNGRYDMGEAFVDTDLDMVYDFGEPTDITEGGGGYALEQVPVGPARVRVIVPNSWAITSPAVGFRAVTMNSGGTIINQNFGLRNLATRDFGDLPAPYPTTEAQNGPTHTVFEGFRLGTRIDGEINGQPTNNNAAGDNAISGDEDGVTITTNAGKLVEGTNTLQIEVAGEGGWLNAWMDFNGDGDWTDAGEQIFTNVPRNPGMHNFTITIPDGGLDDDPIASRFRWGPPNLSFTGPAFIGEVEDYLFETTTAPVVQDPLAGDYNGDGEVGDADYLLWKATFGSTFDLRADGNDNNIIDTGDYTIWMDNKGAVAAGGSSAGGAVAAGSGAALGNTPRAPLTSGPQKSPLTITPEIAALYGLTATTIQVGGETRTFYSYNPLSQNATASGSAAESAPASSGAASGQGAVAGGGAVGSDGDTSPATPVALAFDLSQLSFGSDVQAGGSVVLDDSQPSAGALESDLDLLDDVLAAFAADDDDESEAEPLRISDDDEDALSELALAAVFDDDTDWRLLN